VIDCSFNLFLTLVPSKVALELEQQVARIISLGRATVIRFPVADLAVRLQTWNGSPVNLVRAAMERAGLEGSALELQNGRQV
jgi:hypothetical protein